MSAGKKVNVALYLVIAAIIGLFLSLFIKMELARNEAKSIFLYNPHDSNLTVQIDKEEYVLETGKKQKISLFSGTHKVTSSLNGSIIIDTTIQLTRSMYRKGGLINLSGESFYLWTEYYGSPVIEDIFEPKDSSALSNSILSQRRRHNSKLLLIDSTLVYGCIKEYPPNEFTIERVWFYDIKSSFEEQIQSSSSNSITLGEPLSKIFDKKSFLTYWHENYGESSIQN